MPNRVAKKLSNSPQLSNLLDGDVEGVLEMEGQQKRATMEMEKEHRIRETADTGFGPSSGTRDTGPRPTEQKQIKPRVRNFKPKATSEVGGQTTEYPKVVHDSWTQARVKIFNKESQANPKMSTTESQTHMEPRLVSEEGVQTATTYDMMVSKKKLAKRLRNKLKKNE